MKQHHKLIPAVAIALFVITVVASQSAAAGTPINERTTMEPDGKVTVSNVAGKIVVEGWNRNEVELTGELADRAERLEFSTDKRGRDVRIEVILKKNGHKRRNQDKRWHWDDDSGESDLYIKMPRTAEIAASAVSADITVTGVDGSQDLQSVSGDIEARLGAAESEVSTVSGDALIVGNGASSELIAGAVSGDLEIKNVSGIIQANTVSGELMVDAGTIERGRLKTVSGEIELTGRLAPSARLSIESVSGDVTVAFDENVDAEFEMESFSGDIDGFFGNEPERTGRFTPGKKLDFRQGSGSAKVEIATMSGDIENKR